MPDFSGDRAATGQHDVGVLGDGAGALLEADDEGRALQCGERALRVGEILDLDTTDDSASSRPPMTRRGWPGRRGRVRRGSSAPSQAAATSARAASSATGHRAVGWAGHRRRAPRSPARRHPGQAGAGVRGDGGPDGQCRAARQPLTDEQDGTGRGEELLGLRVGERRRLRHRVRSRCACH